MRTGRKVVTVMAIVAVLVVTVGTVTQWSRIVAWYEFRRDFEGLGKNAQGYAEYRHRPTGIVFVRLPGGTFTMGSPEDESERSSQEGPQHEVTLSPFLIAKYEVSQAEWKRVMRGSSDPSDDPSQFKGASLPVENVSWDDIQEFEKRSGSSDGTRLTLPTEAQWEYACRAGTTTPFAFGRTITSDQVNYSGNYPYGGAAKGESRGKTVAVKEFKPNHSGLFNMHGNVWEWCEDVYDAEYYSKPASRNGDVACQSGSVRRVLRGGGWYNRARVCRSAVRVRDGPAGRNDGIGFRPSRSLR